MTYESLLTNAVVQALGWALLHFFWQGALLAMLLRAVNAIAVRTTSPRMSARIRYAAACAVMLLMVTAVLITFAESYALRAPSAAGSATRSEPVPNIIPGGTPSPMVAVAPAARVGFTGWVVSVWFAGVLILSGRATGAWIRTQIVKRSNCRPVPDDLMLSFEKLKHRLRVSRPVRIYASARTDGPMVIGWIRPFILLPATALTGLNELQLRAILAHELSHIRRHDYLINLLQTAVETILFYHPAVWWVGRQMRIERENCCDDAAVAVCGDAVEYARALAQLEELRLGPPEPAMAASGGELLGRIRRLLEHQPATYGIPRSAGTIAAAVLILVVGLTPMMWSLNAAPEEQLQEKREVVAQTESVTPFPEPVLPEAAPQNSVGLAFPQQAAPIERIPGNGIGNGIGNGPGTGIFGTGELRRTIAESRAVLEELRRYGLAELQPTVSAGPSPQSTEMLIKLYDGTQDVEVKRHILDYLGASSSPQALDKVQSVARSDAEPELRRHAMDYILGKSDAGTLIKLYDDSRDPDTKRYVLDYLGSSSSPQASEKVLSIAKSDPELPLRRLAIDYIGSRANAFDTLVDLYDNIREPELKRHIVDYIGSLSDPRALQKLFSIAQSDPDRNLRRLAVDYIGSR